MLDFAAPCIGLAIELDGGQHLDRQTYDARRTKSLGAAGYEVLRFWNDDVLLRTQQVSEAIWRSVQLRRKAKA